MKGLLYKDFASLFSLYGKNICMTLGLYFVLALAMGMPTFLLMFCWMSGNYVVNLFSVDQTCGWDTYVNCLPVTRAQIISSRYIMLPLCLLASGAVSSVLLFVLSLAGKTAFWEQLVSCAAVLVLSLGLFGLTLMLCVKFGAEKARMLNTVLFLGLFGLIFLTVYAAKNSSSASFFTALAQNAQQYMKTGVILGSILCVAMYAVGWVLSIRIYQAKEL